MGIDIINLLLSFLTLISGLGILLFLTYLIFIASFNKKILILQLKRLINQSGPWMILSFSTIATLGSLFFSEIAGYNPCVLCWYQRIFMYPLVISSIILIYKNTKELLYFILPMSFLGIIFAGYHYFIRFLSPILLCSIDGANCAIKEFMTFGYITIPMMALTAFMAIFIISLLMLFSKKD
jgi:disulfide bond formation protein DsbB